MTECPRCGWVGYPEGQFCQCGHDFLDVDALPVRVRKAEEAHHTEQKLADSPIDAWRTARAFLAGVAFLMIGGCLLSLELYIQSAILFVLGLVVLAVLIVPSDGGTG